MHDSVADKAALAAELLHGAHDDFRYHGASRLPEPAGRLVFTAEPDDEAFLDVFRRVLSGRCGE